MADKQMVGGATTSSRVGIIGYGFIGRSLAEWLVETDGVELAGVWSRSPATRKHPAPEYMVSSVEALLERAPGLIIEAAHPAITRKHGCHFLQVADYIPLSVTALADARLLAALTGAAETSGRKLLIPHGALVGLDSLLEWREQWADVAITFRKHPSHIDFSEAGLDPAGIVGPTVLYDGPARGIARLYPRNVNTMITCALVTIGLDRLRAILIADPGLDRAEAEVVAVGKDGSRLQTIRQQPAAGVSGTEMIASLHRSIIQARCLYQAVDFL